MLTDICKECIVCNIEKEHTSNYGIPTCKNITDDVNEVLAIDIKGPIKVLHFEDTDIESDFYILVAVDIFSRYTEIAIILDINSETICNELEKIWLAKYPYPKICLTDNGRQFTSMNFKNLLEKYKIKHVKSAPQNPTGNGVVERINKEIGTVQRISRKSSRKELIRNIWRKLNLTVNTNTNYAPYEIYYKSSIFKNFGRKINIDKEDIVKRACKKNEKYQMRQEKSRIPVNYKYGDKVYVKSFSKDKLNPKWKGPFEIIEKSKNGNNLYVDAFNKKLRVSIKNCRPHKKGEDVMYVIPSLKMFAQKNML
ncbi:Pol polyprotein [Dictyocoela muelleri]|nr:Pol polyprotein [Dictyocoela muelleri]